MRFAFLLFLIFINCEAMAQYSGPAVEACRAYAKKQLFRDANTAKDVVIDRDTNLVIERYTRKAGSQFVSSILTGNGAVVFDNAPSAELGFICLLADEKRPVRTRIASRTRPGANTATPNARAAGTLLPPASAPTTTRWPA